MRSGQRPEGGATGGGVSVIFPRPSWQAVQVTSRRKEGSIDGRVIPDVTALAGPPYYDLIFQGKDSPNGGTSAAAPLWASMLARASNGQPPRFLTPLLYGTAEGGGTLGSQACSDIKTGNNNSPGVKGYVAGPGYDAVSGWGTPIGVQLQRLLA